MSTDPKQIIAALRKLKKMFPQPGAMQLEGAYQTLVGVILSARTRDEQVLKLLPAFFERFPNIEALVQGSEAEIRTYIKTIGMNGQKAKNLKKMAERVRDVYGGEIPDTMEDLISLAGVGRKTASVILPSIFGTSAVAVDTHVHRVSNRLGWVKSKTPAQTEKQLLKLIPPKDQHLINEVMVKFGRYICLPGKPRCWACPIADMCPYGAKNLDRPRNADAILKKIEEAEENILELRRRIEKSG